MCLTVYLSEIHQNGLRPKGVASFKVQLYVRAFVDVGGKPPYLLKKYA